MNKYEYKILIYPLSKDWEGFPFRIIDQLNEFAQEGWRVVSTETIDCTTKAFGSDVIEYTILLERQVRS